MSELRKKLGRLLQMERDRKGINLPDIAAELKISQGSLEAIEAGDSSALPSDLYYNLFAKSYAEYLGIDYAKTIEAIKEDLGELELNGEDDQESDKEGSIDSDDEQTTGPGVDHKTSSDDAKFGKRALYYVGGIIVIFVVTLFSYQMFWADDTATPEESSPVEFAAEQDQPDENSQNRPGYHWGTVSAVEPDSLTLVLTAREQSWATVLADGDTIIYRNLVPWREYRVPAKYRLLVSVGIPRLVDIKLDGQLVNLKHQQTGRISRVEINQVNRDEILSRPLTVAREPAPEPNGGQNANTGEPGSTETDEN